MGGPKAAFAFDGVDPCEALELRRLNDGAVVPFLGGREALTSEANGMGGDEKRRALASVANGIGGDEERRDLSSTTS